MKHNYHTYHTYNTVCFELVFFFELVLKKAKQASTNGRHGSDSLYGLRASDWHGPGVLWECVCFLDILFCVARLAGFQLEVAVVC